MKKRKVLSRPFKRIVLSDPEMEMIEKYGKNLSVLYEFIGEHSKVNGRTTMGSAYYIIRAIANRYIRNDDAKISKREVRSLICYPKGIIKITKYISIPFRICIIIRAIFGILDLLRYEGVSFPDEIQQFSQSRFRDVFYNEQYETFSRLSNEVALDPEEKKLEADLSSDIILREMEV